MNPAMWGTASFCRDVIYRVPGGVGGLRPPDAHCEIILLNFIIQALWPLLSARPINRCISYFDLLIEILIVDNTWNFHRTILRVITATGTTSCTPRATISLPLHNRRRPQDINIAIRAAQRWLLPRIAMQMFTLVSLKLIAFRIHILMRLPQSSRRHPVIARSTSIHILPHPLLEPRRRNVREVLESEPLFLGLLKYSEPLIKFCQGSREFQSC